MRQNTMNTSTVLIILATCLQCVLASGLLDFVETFKGFTVATHETDGYRQFLRSARTYNIPLEILGFGRKWEGGDMRRAGGGFKVNLLKEALARYKDNKNQIIIFTDSYDVLYLSKASTIISKFLDFDARIVFSAETWIWPDTSLKDSFPEVKKGYRFLNSGAFMGYTNSIYDMLHSATIENDTDDQLFYIKLFVDTEIRNRLRIKLDTNAEIFQNLFAAADDLKLLPKGNVFELYNVMYNTKPCILHGNGLSKLVTFRTIGNYLAGRWKSDDGCQDCDDATINLHGLKISEYPKIVVGVFIYKPTPFFREFLEKIFKQDYPKKKMLFFIYNGVSYHQIELDDILTKYQRKYADFKLVKDSDNVNHVTARSLALDYCIQKQCDSFLNIDSDAHLDNDQILSNLVKQNRSVIGPLLTKPYKTWSNFWGALNNDGFYKRSFDYMDIVNFRRKGIWNMPYISSCYLINATVLKNSELKPVYSKGSMDYDMAFCDDMREKGVYMYIDNREEYGHLTDLDGFDITKTNPNLYELMTNRLDWEEAYLHPEYRNNFINEIHLQPCPDVYWFPIVSPRFCKEFIEIMETYGQWSDGTNNDKRLQGGYEAVPTRDVHMNQVGLETQWLEFLRLYVTPIQEMVFIGYYHNPPRSLMNFVVRYKPDEQPSLRPHHDSSTYTINIALNRPHVDYQGGGCRFLRYNCSVVDMKLGWMLIHPGRLTHFHEGLLVTKGTRYIMISFVDP